MGASATATVVFADLTGSTGVFETLGNAKATEAVTRLTQWISQVCESHGGRVIKTLGDGVLVVFPQSAPAVAAVVELQRNHLKRIMAWPARLRMHLQVGMAHGDIVLVDGDCYGDAVNMASRLSDLSGAEQIWATVSVVEQISEAEDGVRFRSLGPVPIRGKSEPSEIYRIDWQEEAMPELLTAPSPLGLITPVSTDAVLGKIELSWLDVNASFSSGELPIHLGRVDEAQFVVNDQRVSRLHAKVEWRNNTFVLSDLSTYGTWVRFAGSETELALRRGECVLHGSGEIALGAPFSDFTVPTVSFNLSGGEVALAHKAGGRSR